MNIEWMSTHTHTMTYIYKPMHSICMRFACDSFYYNSVTMSISNESNQSGCVMFIAWSKLIHEWKLSNPQKESLILWNRKKKKEREENRKITQKMKRFFFFLFLYIYLCLLSLPMVWLYTYDYVSACANVSYNVYMY